MFLVKDDDNTVLLNLVNIVVLENVCQPCSRDNHFCQISYSCSTVYPVQQPDVRYSSSRPMADDNTVPYIRVLQWIYSTTTGLYSDRSVCSCQNL